MRFIYKSKIMIRAHKKLFIAKMLFTNENIESLYDLPSKNEIYK
jgi:hypothetical protein